MDKSNRNIMNIEEFLFICIEKKMYYNFNVILKKRLVPRLALKYRDFVITRDCLLRAIVVCVWLKSKGRQK